jgi:hypothetical protein
MARCVGSLLGLLSRSAPFGLATWVALLACGGAEAQARLGPLDDRVQWHVLARELVAVDSSGGGEHRAPLGVGERVLETWVDGEVGVAQTGRRLIAVSANTGGVHELRFRAGERVVTGPLLGDRVALVVTSERALGFDGGSGNWLEASLGPQERVVATAVANHVAALATDRRALALSPVRGGLFEVPLALQEAPVSLSASGDLATLRTRTRLLVYRASGSRWSERSTGLGN